MVDATTDHGLIFETAAGFCGIAWNSVGITRTRERGRYVIRFAIGRRSATRGHYARYCARERWKNRSHWP